ncbi:MAG: pitrilysin family protein [Mucinivorans sp.]
MIKYERRILANGLTVLAHTDGSTPMASVNVLYKVGSKNENPDATGFAHLFEHLMFGGSKNVPDFDTPIQEAGGENNAFTNNDYTNYYITLPKENIQTALWAESDRMASLNFDERSLDVQRKVVVEEFAQRYLNQPYGDTWLLLRPLCYKVHPYQWSTIGKSIDHIRGASMEQVRAFFYRYYCPANAILSIAGNFSTDEIFELAERWFSDIPSSSAPQDVIEQEPVQTEQRILVVERDVPSSMIYIAFPIGGRATREYVVCDVISDLLSNGTSSRLYQRLIKQKSLFSSVNAYVTGEIDAGLFVLTGSLLDGVSFEVAQKALLQQMEELKSVAVSDYELQKVKNKFEANDIYSQINVLSKAMNLAFFEFVGDASLINAEVSDHNSVTQEEIFATCATLFTPEHSNILHYQAKPTDENR